MAVGDGGSAPSENSDSRTCYVDRCSKDCGRWGQIEHAFWRARQESDVR